jgi:hypothetical protein
MSVVDVNFTNFAVPISKKSIMEAPKKKGLTLFAKISIIINTLLFGITGVIFLANKSNMIGIVLLAAGLTNILYILVTINTNNYFFVILNFLYALITLIVGITVLIDKEPFMGLVWMIITIYYLITGFTIMLNLMKKKHKANLN